MSERVKAQYEAYPYPTRDPKDEDHRLVTGSPSHLDEINHYLFAGRLDLARPLRALVAGGGTGDGAIMLAQQLAERCPGARIVHLDLSRAAQDVARARAARRGLDNLDFVSGSLLEVATLAPGPFDYIDCCGVLHHLPAPADGLAALAAALAPHGGMGLMVYAPLGRAGVYEVQAALRHLAPFGAMPEAERIATARRLLRALPAGHPLRRNPQVRDHLDGGDAGVYDLLLHDIDRPYRVPELIDLLAGAGLAPAGFIEPARYQPERYCGDPALARRMADLPERDRWSLAELLAGNIKTHVVYAVPEARAPGAVAVAGLSGTEADAAAVPVLRDLSGPELARGLQGRDALSADLDGIAVRYPLPRLASAMLQRIDGQTALARIGAELGCAPDAFYRQFAQLYAAFNGLNRMLLRYPS